MLAWLRQLLLHRVGKLRRRYRDTQKRRLAREVALGGDDSSDGPAGGLAANVPSPSGQAMEHEQDQALQAALGRLPEDYRRVITLRYEEQLPFEEIGRTAAALAGRRPEALGAGRRAAARGTGPAAVNVDDSLPPDEQFASVLAAWDEALAAGATPGRPPAARPNSGAAWSVVWPASSGSGACAARPVRRPSRRRHPPARRLGPGGGPPVARRPAADGERTPFPRAGPALHADAAARHRGHRPRLARATTATSAAKWP